MTDMRETAERLVHDWLMSDIEAIKRRAEAARSVGCIFTPDHYIRVMTQDIPALLTALSAAEAKVRELTERVTKYRARLEVAGHFEPNKATGEMDRVVLPFDEDELCDGIACRDETIKLQDHNVDTLRARVQELEAALDGLRTAAAEPTKPNWIDKFTDDIL